MHPLSQFLLNLLQLSLHSVPPGLPRPRRDLPLMKVNPKKLKVSGFEPRWSASRRLQISHSRNQHSAMSSSFRHSRNASIGHGGKPRLHDDRDLIVVAVTKPVEGHAEAQ
jgi:hypothetical protein